MTKFEVGKKYRYDGRYEEECLAVTDDFAWLKAPGYRGSIVDRVHNGWKEVKEPRTVSRWVNIWDVGGELSVGGLHSTRESALASNPKNTKRVDVIEISYTEKV